MVSHRPDFNYKMSDEPFVSHTLQFSVKAHIHTSAHTLTHIRLNTHPFKYTHSHSNTHIPTQTRAVILSCKHYPSSAIVYSHTLSPLSDSLTLFFSIFLSFINLSFVPHTEQICFSVLYISNLFR